MNGRSTGKVVVVLPVGGCAFVWIESEGFHVAERLAAQGCTAFLPKYRPRRTPASTEGFLAELSASFGSMGSGEIADHEPAVDDLAAAVALVSERAQQSQIDPHAIGVIKFSAGARSTTVRIRSLRLVASWSCTKSIAHTSFGRIAGDRSSRSFALTCRLGVLLRSCNPKSL
jgi:dienelactone hydrolase